MSTVNQKKLLYITITTNAVNTIMQSLSRMKELAFVQCPTVIGWSLVNTEELILLAPSSIVGIVGRHVSKSV